VVLRVVLCHTGLVTDIKVMKRLPHGVTEKAIEAARRVKFVPAEKDGQKVSQSATFEYGHNPE
jgi:TonB family protein